MLSATRPVPRSKPATRGDTAAANTAGHFRISLLALGAAGMLAACATGVGDTGSFGDGGVAGGNNDASGSATTAPPSSSSSSGSGSGSSGSSPGDVGPDTGVSVDDGGADANGDGTSASDSSGGPSDGGSAANACPSGLLDKVTACTATSPSCVKGCGPDTAVGSLGTKGCSCNSSTMVYNCQNCAYPLPLPTCYAPATTPATCASGVANGGTCTAPCSGVCVTKSSAGKTDGCVCVQRSSGSTWSCATQWW